MIAIATKTCGRCAEVKSVDCFYDRPDRKGVKQSVCKACAVARTTERGRAIAKLDLPPVPEKECRGCRVVKPACEFNRHRARLDGLTPKCKECTAKVRLAKVQANLDASRDPPSEKMCRKCLEMKPRDAFSVDYTTPDTLKRWCRMCVLECDRKRKYALDEEWLSRVRETNSCEICGIAFGDGSRKAVVDHDHATDEVRGVLCSACNRGIGFLRDDVSIMQSAIVYLSKNKEQGADYASAECR